MSIELSGRQWDAGLGFLLFCVGYTTYEIADKFKVAQSTVATVSSKDDWVIRRADFLDERIKRIGSSVSKEQEFIKSQEADLSRRLLGLGHEMLRTLIRSPKTDVADLCRVLELASTLGRRSTGMPMQAIELSVTHDIAEDVKRMLDKAYSDDPKAIDVEQVDTPDRTGLRNANTETPPAIGG